MKLAKCLLNLSRTSAKMIYDVTPAEVMYLAADRHRLVGKNPIEKLEETGEVERTAREEVERLRSKYVPKKVNKLFTGAIPQLPESFEEATQLGCDVVLPQTKFINDVEV